MTKTEIERKEIKLYQNKIGKYTGEKLIVENGKAILCGPMIRGGFMEPCVTETAIILELYTNLRDYQIANIINTID